MRDIVIISQNRELSRFAELESMACGFSVRALTRVPADLSAYGMIIIDVDTIDESDVICEGSVIAVTADRDKAQRLADKYDVLLEYPFLLKSLRAAIVNMGTRMISAEERSREHTGIFYVDIKKNEIELNGFKLTLSDNELKVLCKLCSVPKTAVNRAELDSILGVDGGNMSDVYVCHLRKKLGTVTKQRIIYTVRNVGYMTDHCVEFV